MKPIRFGHLHVARQSFDFVHQPSAGQGRGPEKMVENDIGGDDTQEQDQTWQGHHRGEYADTENLAGKKRYGEKG